MHGQGLSPRARGNRPTGWTGSTLLGPIPASAGEPTSGQLVKHCLGAYPRERGGTVTSSTGDSEGKGLSPRARGNLGCARALSLSRGPIPASAGEPQSLRRSPAMPRAYPRERGGTLADTSRFKVGMGLSPRARGNHLPRAGPGAGRGPIPASAGEPRPRWSSTHKTWAYPRERGGTSSRKKLNGIVSGLSPRARGNL